LQVAVYTVTKFALQVHRTCVHQLADSPRVWPTFKVTGVRM